MLVQIRLSMMVLVIWASSIARCVPVVPDAGQQRQLAEGARAVKNDPWQGYYDFIINEGSFKFWAVFQVATALLLIYSAAAAIYYAKYNFIQPDYDYGDYFFGRADGGDGSWPARNPQLAQRILDAISSQKYA